MWHYPENFLHLPNFTFTLFSVQEWGHPTPKREFAKWRGELSGRGKVVTRD